MTDGCIDAKDRNNVNLLMKQRQANLDFLGYVKVELYGAHPDNESYQRIVSLLEEKLAAIDDELDGFSS
tara:strand:+ start:2947 stop:3153 length:207 start_codon:yes stop_codon:yes gene_type:complete